jgi:hypothetical protein
MSVHRYNKRVVCLFFISSITINVLAARELVIVDYRQLATNSCWAACSYMVLDAYNHRTSEMDIRRWAFPPNGDDHQNQLSGSPTSTAGVLSHFGSINSYFDGYNTSTGGGNISQSNITQEIDQGRPILAGRVYFDNNLNISYGHMYVIRGYTGNGGSSVGDVIYNDPDPRIGGRRAQSYAEFVRRGNEYQWYETLRLTTNPRPQIPTGIGSGERVRIYDYSSTTRITQSPQSLSFEANKGGVHVPVNWNWRLVFPHVGGEYVAATWTVTSSSFQSVWNISNFVLPSNYQWKYNYDGIIPGRVEVLVNDNAGPPAHEDAVDVLYVPSNLYPGVIVYQNKTVSNAQPEVKAHELIILRNDQFLPGSSINFKSGDRIDIGNGVTIQDGSNVNFTIDPSIR